MNYHEKILKHHAPSMPCHFCAAAVGTALLKEDKKKQQENFEIKHSIMQILLFNSSGETRSAYVDVEPGKQRRIWKFPLLPSTSPLIEIATESVLS